MEVIVENACITLNKKEIIRNFNCKISNHIYGLMGANGSCLLYTSSSFYESF